MTHRVTPILLVSMLLLMGCDEPPKETVGDEILVEVERTAVSKAKKPQDILPYDEALVWHEYEVKEVLEGELTAPKIRIAHWTVVAAKPVVVDEKLGERQEVKIRPFENVAELASVASSDDLDFSTDVPRFIDLTQSRASDIPPAAMRLDYRGFFSEQMALYWKLRPQLKLVVMGNSHATKGICTSMFFGAPNSKTPLALNLAPAGANNVMQCLLTREYIAQLPQLEWVVWVVSARSFNESRLDDRKLNEFLGSTGRKYDLKHQSTLWPLPTAQPPVTIEELEKLNVKAFDFWGWEGRSKTKLPLDPVEQRKAIMSELDSTRFTFSQEIFKEFTDTVRMLNDKGVRVLLLTTPLHPLSAVTEASDPDGTTHEGFKEMVRHMEGLDQELPLTWFRDYHKDGNHEYPAAEFYDVDHLTRVGSRKLTVSIIEWMKTCQKPTAMK